MSRIVLEFDIEKQTADKRTELANAIHSQLAVLGYRITAGSYIVTIERYALDANAMGECHVLDLPLES